MTASKAERLAAAKLDWNAALQAWLGPIRSLREASETIRRLLEANDAVNTIKAEPEEKGT